VLQNKIRGESGHAGFCNKTAFSLHFNARFIAIDVPDRGRGSNQAKQNGNTLILCGITDTIHFAHDAIPLGRSGNPGSKLLIFSIIVLEISAANRHASRE